MTDEIKLSENIGSGKLVRLGGFSVKANMIESPLIRRAMVDLQFVPVKVELAYGGMFEMVGFSPAFAEIPAEMMAPRYEINIKLNDGKYEGIEVKPWGE